MEPLGKAQFDANVGGDVALPPVLPIQPFVRARMNEIEALTKLIETPSSTIHFKKKFPKHLRRRAMSHNVKRLPSRLRDEHIILREKSGTKEIPLKRPRRRYRRRPINLLSEYNRRQKKNIWLETHIWHAKRFHMTEKWGYKLPLHPNDKSYRACYRATTQHCLIQDISYYCCVELSGEVNDILEGLKDHCSSECGLTFGSKSALSGLYEGTTFFYQSNKYPWGAIGEIKYFWEPSESSFKKIWLWSHPSFYPEVLNELISTFSFVLIENMEVEDNQRSSNECNAEMLKLDLRNVPFMKTPKYWTEKSSVKMVLLKDTMNRFRLIGPHSQALLTEAFHPIDLKQRKVHDWASSYFEELGESQFVKQTEFWKQLEHALKPNQFPRHMIMSSIISDPRFTFPRSRYKAEPKVKDEVCQPLSEITAQVSKSPIWSSDVRDCVTNTKLSSHEINEMRSNKLVPGLEIESKDTNINDFPAIPILLIHQPGEEQPIKPLGFGSGWDLIVPSGYGLPVWLALHLHGGRAGGLKEQASVYRESCKVMFSPDTSAATAENKMLEEDGRNKYFALPQGKRQNYIKLGIVSPFLPPWQQLMQDWTGDDKFYVLRGRKELSILNEKLKGSNQEFPIEKHKQALIAVVVMLTGKGTIENNSLICLPEEDDQEKFFIEKGYSGPVEKAHCDTFEPQRSALRAEHKALLKKWKRKRNKSKENQEEVNKYSSKNIVEEQKETMKDLWIPKCTTVKDHCERVTFGFICESDFSLTSARSVGIGFVTVPGLFKLFGLSNFKSEYKKKLVLVRSTNTLQYRFGNMFIVT